MAISLAIDDMTLAYSQLLTGLLTMLLAETVARQPRRCGGGRQARRPAAAGEYSTSTRTYRPSRPPRIMILSSLMGTPTPTPIHPGHASTCTMWRVPSLLAGGPMLQPAATGHVLVPAKKFTQEIDPPGRPAGRGTSSGASSRRELVIDTSGLRTFQPGN